MQSSRPSVLTFEELICFLDLRRYMVSKITNTLSVLLTAQEQYLSYICQQKAELCSRENHLSLYQFTWSEWEEKPMESNLCPTPHQKHSNFKKTFCWSGWEVDMEIGQSIGESTLFVCCQKWMWLKVFCPNQP